MTATELDTDSAVASLTSALVESNDRLLGLLGLITADAPPSLDVAEMIDWVLDRANSILAFDCVEVSGPVDHVWGTSATSMHTWSDRPRTDAGNDLLITYGRSDVRFATADTKLLAAVTALVANAVATAELHRAQLDQELVASEHQTVSRITTMALPDADSAPQLDGLSMFCDLVPARTTGGDLYTWREVDGDLWFAMGDVSGKGLPAAVLMTSIMSTIEAAIQRSSAEGPSSVMAEVERIMYRRLSDAAMFVTLAVGRWSSRNAELSMVNCGHSPIVYCGAGRPERVSATAPPIGVLEGLQPETFTRETKPGDVLVIATDGFTEQVGADGLLFGEDRFDTSVAAAALSAADADTIGRTLLTTLETFSAGYEQADDRALMVVRFT